MLARDPERGQSPRPAAPEGWALCHPHPPHLHSQCPSGVPDRLCCMPGPFEPSTHLSVVPFNLTSMRRLYPVCLSCFWGEGGGPCKIVTTGRGKSWRAAVQPPCNPFLQISRLLEVPGVSPLHGQGSPGQQAAGSPVPRPARCRQQGSCRSLDVQLPSLSGTPRPAALPPTGPGTLPSKALAPLCHLSHQLRTRSLSSGSCQELLLHRLLSVPK